MLRRFYIDNGFGGQAHLSEAGKGEPIFLLHQTPRSADEFYEVMKILQARYKLTAMDLPGMGSSDPIELEPTIEGYAKVAAVAMRSEVGPVTVCGHHTGAVVAIELATHCPELVKSLVLSSPPWRNEEIRTKSSQRKPIDTESHTPSGYHLIGYWEQRAPYYPKEHSYLDRFIRDVLRARNAAEGHLAVSNYKLENVIDRIHVPTLVIEHRQDPFASKHIKEVLQALPNAKHRIIEDGQVALEVTANKFAAILDEWMQALEPSSFRKEV